jgi:hypothetical protein
VSSRSATTPASTSSNRTFSSRSRSSGGFTDDEGSPVRNRRVAKTGRSDKSKKPGIGHAAPATSNGAGSNLFLTAAEQRVAEKKAEKKDKEETYSFLREDQIKDVCKLLTSASLSSSLLEVAWSTLGIESLILSFNRKKTYVLANQDIILAHSASRKRRGKVLQHSRDRYVTCLCFSR